MTSFNTIIGNTGRPQILVDEQSLAAMQQQLRQRGLDLERLRHAYEVLAATNEPTKFLAAAMALCNQLAAKFGLTRAGLGILRGRYVRLRALSHTEKITRQMQLVLDIESAMEEALDQDNETIFPPAKDASYVYRAAEHLANRHGPSAVVALPLRRAGKVHGVLLVERKIDKPFSAEEIESLRLIAELVTARMLDLYDKDRFVAVKAAKATRHGLSYLVGAKHTWVKVLAVAVLGLAGFAIFAKGTYKVDAPFVVETVEKQLVSAPFEGLIRTVNADVGDTVVDARLASLFDAVNAPSPVLPDLLPVRPAHVLATLDTAELQNRLAEAKASLLNAEQQMHIARKEGKTSEVQLAEAEADKARAQVRLYEWQIERGTLRANITGTIFSGDLKKRIGGKTQTGEVLFEIGAQHQLRAELSVPEDMVAELKVGQTGQLASLAAPERKYTFRVERINPIAEAVETRNVFKVRVSFIDPPSEALKPGVEGLAKVHAGEASYGWIWTHRLVNWVRMKLWL